MYEYKTMKCQPTYRQTEEKLNELAIQGWKVLCVYGLGSYFVLERKR